MQFKTLHQRKRKYFLLILLLCLAGMTKTYAYDFSAVCETGQTLYYNITNATNHYVALTYPGTVNYNGWSGYTQPTGNIILPENVQNNGITYTVTSIGNYAFDFCYGLTGSLNIPNSVTSIGYYAFSGCWGLTSIFIPSSVTYIATNPFESCHGLAQIIVDSESTVYDSRENCNAIIKTSTNELVTGCKNTVIPNSVISIGANAFRECNSLTSISIPNSVIAIGSDAFEYCGLTSIFIPNSVTYIGTNPFQRCSGLSQIIVDSGNTVYDSREDCNAIIKTSTNELVTGCKNTVIPISVASIGYSAFRGCGGLKSIVIPNHVTSIGMYAFYNCYNLVSVTFSNSVITIGHSAFEDCNNIKLITFGNSVASIGPRAFYSYYSYSPYRMTILSETPPTLDSNYSSVFTNVDKTIPMYVPYGTSEAYMAADGWNEFTNYIEMAPTYTISAESVPVEAGTVSINMEESTLVTEPFEEYSVGNKIASAAIAAGHDWWTTWGNAPGSSQDGVVANFDNTQCGHLTYGNDMVFLLGDKKNGNYDIEFDILVPNGKNGFFNILHHFGGSNSIWAMQCYLHLTHDGQNSTSTPGHGTIHAGSNNTADLPCVYDAWMHFRLNIDIDNDTARYYYTAPGENESLICEWQWSLESFGNYVADCNLAALNFYPPKNAATSEFYLDNISIKQKSGNDFTDGSTCSLTATPNEGYVFENWSNEGNIVSDSTTYSFIVTEDATYMANFTWTNPFSVDYVSDGLIMYLDGINNTRNGHSTTTNVWEDLMGNYDLTVTNYNSYTWENNHFIGLGNGGYLDTEHTWQYFNSLNNDLTIEIVTYIDCDKTTPSYRGIAGWHEWSDGTNIQNDQGSSRMQTLGGLPVSEADDMVATISYTKNNGSFLNGLWKVDDGRILLGANSNYGAVFGNSHWSGRGWNDSIYCIRMYNRSLTPEEVAYNHSIDIERFGAGFPVIDTTIYAEICQGEDYLQNGFEIYYPEVGENQYSITLPSSQGIDSIVNLTLTVHPTYYVAEDTTLCNTTSFQWHGNTYTESGLYYDTLQTIHGCDSIYALSLEFFNTPLGEFTYMNPTNNYPFTSLPIIFSWDAVSGAEYYNLYLWNVNEPVPSTPYAGNIYNRSCYVPSLQNHQTYNWYVEAVNTCFTTTSSVRSFSLNIPPTMNVSVSNLNFGEVALNNSNTLNLYVNGNALDDTITMQMTGEDASMFSYMQGNNWNGLTGGLLSVTFSPTAVQYNYTANLVITTGTLTQTVQLTGSLADMFVFNTYVTQDVFEMNSTVPIYGTVMDANNNPAASAEVEVKVTVMNMTRSLFATTGADGHFSVDFVPAYSESGYYTINSGRVGHNSTAVHDDFNIPGMNLVTNDWILWDVVQNETSTGSIVIRNRSQIPLNNIQVTSNTLPEGCSFTFQPLSLAGMEEGVLEYSVNGTTPTNGYQEVALVATSSEGASLNFTVWYRCAEPRGNLYASPNDITTTMTKGINKIVDVMLYNNGTGPTGSVYLDLPSVDWLSVVGNDTLPSIAVQDSAYFSLRLSANENTPLVQYTGNIAINCERGDGLLLPYTIMAVSDSTGTLIVDVTDDYTYNGNGQHLQGATVTVKGYYSLETAAVGLTDSNGLFTVTDIPEGYYRMSITAPHHAEYQATIQIEGGQTNTQNIYLQYQAITYSWNVVPTEIPDEYSFELVVVFETNVPVPVVTIEMPETFPELEAGESFVFNYIVTNHGLINSYDATLYPPTGHPLYEFTPLITEIDTLRAQETIVIPCTMTRRTSQRSQKVEEALNVSGNRDYYYECPYMARTSIRSYYICRGERIPIYGYRLVNIGSYPCTMAIGIYEPWHEHEPNHHEPYHHDPVPPVTWQQHGCSDDPCQSEALEELNSCPPENNNTPKLPPFQPGNRRNN